MATSWLDSFIDAVIKKEISDDYGCRGEFVAGSADRCEKGF